MYLKNILKFAISPQWWFTEKVLFSKKKDLLPYSGEIIPNDSIDGNKIREGSEEKARNSTIPSYIVCKAIELKAGDVIIHDYSRFKISECGCGFGAGNEFGNYFWVKGCFVDGNPTDPKPLKDFWSFQECPVIKLC